MATPLTIADAAIAVAGDLAGFNKDVDKALADTESKSKTAGQRISAAFSPAKVGAALGGAFGAIGVAAIKMGGQVDEAFDVIRIGTGATGDELRGLESDFKAVAGDVTDDMGLVAQVIADLNTRTGQTGEGLQTLGKQILDMSRITKTDAVGNVALATRVFGDWSIATENQGDTLDGLFRISQATGIGIDELMGKVVQFGAPLRNIGFTIEESAAMLGKWEKEGVNTELALGGLKIALGGFAKEGVNAKEGLADLVAQILEFGPGAESMALGAQHFGSRAGPDMVAAILEGRFAIDEYVDAYRNGADTIESVTEDTEDMGDALGKWIRKTRVQFGSLFTTFGGVAEAAGPFLLVLPAITSGLGSLAGMAAKALPGLATSLLGLVPALGGVLATVGSSLGGLIAAAIPIGMALLPFILIAAVVAAIVFLVNNPEIVSKIAEFAGSLINNLVDFLLDLPGALVDVFAMALGAVLGALPGFVVAVAKFILSIPGRIVGLQAKLIGFFAGIAGKILGGIGTLVGEVVKFVLSIPGKILGLAAQLGTFFAGIGQKITSRVSAFVGEIVRFFLAIPGRIVKIGGEIVAGIIRGMASLPGKLADVIRNAFKNLKIDIGPFHISASGVRIDLPDIKLPSFAEGTPFVPATSLAVVHRGERIVTAEDNAALGRGATLGGSGTTNNVTVTVQAPDGGDLSSAHRFGQMVADAIADTLREQSARLTEA